MIPKDKVNRLIKIYMYICDMYEQRLKYHCQRYSNNSKPLFSDEEILTMAESTSKCNITKLI